MVEIRQTAHFKRWFERLKDPDAKARILVRIRRLSLGNHGDVRAVRGGVSELRIDHGPGYRVYYVARSVELIVLLVGGDKRTQTRDIERAITLAKNL